MRNKIILALVLILMAIGYVIGSYFVDFALKRGNDDDPKAPPKACANIADPSLSAPDMPNFSNENWIITSVDDLKLCATHFSPTLSSHHWAILVHGYGREQSFAFDYAEEYLKHGYNVLTPDLRAAGKSEGNYLTMGAKESDDILLWIDKIIEADPEAQIALHGVSMGAATVMLAASKETSTNFKVVIEDCGYTSAYTMFTDQLNVIFGLPEFPIMNCVDIMSKIKTGSAISEAAPIDNVQNIKVPMLLIHGTEDKLVPYTMMQNLYDASGAPIKEIISVEGAGHADAKRINPESYFNQIFRFLDKYID